MATAVVRGKADSFFALLCTEKRSPSSTAPTPIDSQPAIRKTAATEAVVDEGSNNEGKNYPNYKDFHIASI